MSSFPLPVRPEEFVHEVAETNRKLLQGLETLSQIRDEDITAGVSDKEAVYAEDKLQLFHFTPFGEQTVSTPVLIVYALVNRPYVADLQDDRSLVRNLLKLGLDVYLIDWGYPTRGDYWLTLDDYINGYINNCVDVIRERHGLNKINLLGICQGGTMSLCYAALYPGKVKNLVLTVTPVDFHVEESLLNVWAGCTMGSQSMNVDLMVDALGNIPGDYMNLGFLMQKPFALTFQKYLDMVDILDQEDKLKNFLRMENWIFDSPDQAGQAYRQFMKDFYQQNKLIKGEVVLGDKQVDLSQVRLPILNVYAEGDHLVPPDSTRALEKYVGSKDYTARNFPVGHIGMYVSGKVQRDLPPTIVEWLKQRP